jgi:septal ring factor EnvC (AmiA/AmiB activator)
MIAFIPRIGRVIVATSVISLALTSAYFYARWQREAAAHANTRTTALAAQASVHQAAAQANQQLHQDKDHAIAQAAKRAQAHRADADSARTELDRLRDTLATAPRHADPNTCPATPHRADPARELLSECAGALADLAAKADRLHADRLTLLEAWPRPTPDTPVE